MGLVSFQLFPPLVSMRCDCAMVASRTVEAVAIAAALLLGSLAERARSRASAHLSLSARYEACEAFRLNVSEVRVTNDYWPSRSPVEGEVTGHGQSRRGGSMEVKNIRWVGIQTANYHEMVRMLRDVMGLS